MSPRLFSSASPRLPVALLLLLMALACSAPVRTRFSGAAVATTRPRTPAEERAPTLPPAGPTAFLPGLLPTGTQPVQARQNPTAAHQPVFQAAECAFPVPPGTHPVCGSLAVPENRARPGSRTIRLQAAIFRSSAPNPAPDPLVFLSGGPGSSALGEIGYALRQGLGGVLASRDLLVFDQRGTGYSEPLMTCPERDALAPALLAGGLSPDRREQAIVDAFRRCHDRLFSAGIDLSAYTSAAIAADVDDLRRALGYDRVDLLGVSYGTRVALTMLRDYPGALRSVTLDSTLPLQVNLYTALAPNAERAFNVLFEHCAGDPACGAAHPHLRETFYQLVDQLNASPMPLILRIGETAYPVLVDGNLLVDVLFTGLYNPFSIARMPEMIDDIRQGNTAILEERLALYFDTSTALGMQMSVICAEELPFSPPDEAERLAQGVQPQIANFFPRSVRPLFAACAGWGAGTPDPRENQPVASNIPTLVLAGEYDPITPPEWGRQAAASLPRAHFSLFPANGHWVTRSSPCALAMLNAFLNDPASTPGDGCIQESGGLEFR